MHTRRQAPTRSKQPFRLTSIKYACIHAYCKKGLGYGQGQAHTYTHTRICTFTGVPVLVVVRHRGLSVMTTRGPPPPLAPRGDMAPLGAGARGRLVFIRDGQLTPGRWTSLLPFYG